MGYLRILYGRSSREFIRAFIAGVELFAWWKDGTQYVGTTGTTLKDAKIEIEELLQKIEEERL